MDALHWSLTLTGALLAALITLGLSLQVGWRRDLARWPHHALFFAVCAGVGLTLALAAWTGRRWWALLPALALLLSMPRTRPGHADHWRRAILIALSFLLGGAALLAQASHG